MTHIIQHSRTKNISNPYYVLIIFFLNHKSRHDVFNRKALLQKDFLAGEILCCEEFVKLVLCFLQIYCSNIGRYRKRKIFFATL